MGLGKTLQVLALIWTLLKQGPEVCRRGGAKQGGDAALGACFGCGCGPC